MDSKADAPASPGSTANEARQARDSASLRPALRPYILFRTPTAMALCAVLGLLGGFALAGVYFQRAASASVAPVCAESPPCGEWSLRHLRAEPHHHDFDPDRRRRHDDARRSIEVEREVEKEVEKEVENQKEAAGSPDVGSTTLRSEPEPAP